MFNSSVFLMLFAACCVQCNVTATCGQKEILDSYLDLAIDMIVRAKYNIPTFPKVRQFSKMTSDGFQPVDCTDVLQMGHNKSGIYEIWPMNRLTEGRPLPVYCDMDTDGGGWTVIQRRGDFGSSKDYFFQNWECYKEGFGDVEKDFWLGNDNIFALTNQKLYSVRFDLEDAEQNRSYAVYDKFWIDDEANKYTLHISIYVGNAGDSMEYHNNQSFSTKDRDNDSNSSGNCAKERKGGWWYNACHYSNLNGMYYNEKKVTKTGINWYHWKDNSQSLQWTDIKIRPKSYKPSFEYKVISY